MYAQKSDSSAYSSDFTSEDLANSIDKQPSISDAATTPVNCTCGDCNLYTLCTSGCPKAGVCGGPLKLVHGIWNGTSPTDRWNESELEHHTKCISHAFADLVDHTFDSFTKKEDKLSRIIMWLQELDAYRPLTDKSLPLLRDRAEEISRAHNVEQLFKILRHYWSWYNFYLLEKLIQRFGDKENHTELSKYLKTFRDFIEERKVLPNSQDSFRAGSKGQNHLLVKVDKSWDRISLKQIWEFHHYLAHEILKVETNVLYLASISKGCICLNFVVPETIAEHIFSCCALEEEALLEVGVFRIKYGEYVWQVCLYLVLFLPRYICSKANTENDVVNVVWSYTKQSCLITGLNSGLKCGLYWWTGLHTR